MMIPKKILALCAIVGILLSILVFQPGSIKGKFLSSSATTSRNYVATGKFVTTWKTDNIGPEKITHKQITIQTNPNIDPNTKKPYVYNYTVDWGDGKKDENLTGSKTHTYDKIGTYTVSISGDFPSFYSGYSSGGTATPLKLLTVEEWGSNVWKTFEQAFFGCENLVINAIDTPNLTEVTNFKHIFAYATNFNSDISSWDTSHVTNMQGVFLGNTLFNKPLNTWNVSQVINMDQMFQGATSFNQDISNWNVSNVTTMNSMFVLAREFNQDLGRWERKTPTVSTVGNVTNMGSMFQYANKFNQDIGNWNVSNVTNMDRMFFWSDSFNQPLEKWNVSNVTNMTMMFYLAGKFNQPLNQWNVSNVTNMNNMFGQAKSFNQPLDQWGSKLSKVTDMAGLFASTPFNQDISSWDVSNVQNMNNMFQSASEFNQPLEKWNVSNVKHMAYMFQGTPFNQPLEKWNVSNVKNMSGMFQSTTAFNQPLEKWNVSNVEDMSNIFQNSKAFNQPLEKWNVSNVKNMSFMFASAQVFNSNISQWNTSKVINMEGMFSSNPAFNQDISNWDVSNVKNMSSMFSHNKAFNGDISKWNVSKVENMSSMFSSNWVFAGDISKWDVSNVRNMSSMFSSNKAFNGDISKWNVSKVENMSSMFSSNWVFAGDISKWDVSNVRNMSSMFSYNKAFNGDISKWNVSEVTDMGSMFTSAEVFNSDISKWNTSKVTQMSTMFANAPVFNSDIGNWDVSNVNNMNGMFSGASMFNSDISKWNVVNVVEMGMMFLGAKAFNSDISGWDISKVKGAGRILEGSGFSMKNYHKLLQGWSSRNVQPDIILVVPSKYCGAAAVAGRDILTTAPNNWEIRDGGLDLLLCPGIPTNLRATIKDSGHVELTWDAAVVSGTPAITDYIIQYKTASSEWITYNDEISTSKKATVSMTFENNVGYNFRVAAKNINETGGYTSASDTVIIDTIAPVVSATLSLPEFHNSLTVPVKGFTATDAVGVTGYMITETNNTPTTTTSGWTPTAPANYTFPAGTTDGSKTLYFWAKDATGNISTTQSKNFILDTTTPTITAFTIPTHSNTQSIPVTKFTVDESNVYYTITESATAPATTATWAPIPTTSFNYTTSSDGQKTLYAWAKDAAGNISLSSHQQIIIDTIAPVVTVFTLPTASNTLTNIPLTITATDAVGVTGYTITTSPNTPALTDIVWSTTVPTKYTFPTGTNDGNQTLYAWAKDAAGQVSRVKSTTINIDRVPPAVASFILPSTMSKSRTISGISLTTNSADVTGYLITESVTSATPGSPSATTNTWSTNSQITHTFGTDGTKTLYAWVKDTAGNVSSEFASQTITIDTTAPLVTHFITPAAVNTLTIPNISIAATDTVGVIGYMITESATAPLSTASNWLTTAPTDYVFAANTSAGNKTLYAWAKDTAGNISLGSQRNIEIDMTKPVTPPLPTIAPGTGVFEISPTAIETNTTSVSVKVTCTSGDLIKVHYGLGSTVSATEVCPTSKNVTLPIPLGNEAKYYTLYTTATDTAGNISAPSPTISIFKNPAATDSAPGIPDLDSLSDSGVSNSDNITNETQPSLTIPSCTSGFMINVYDNTTLIGTIPCIANTAQIRTQSLTSGEHTIVAKQKSPTGVLSLPSAPLSIVIDGTPLSIVFQKQTTGTINISKPEIGFIAQLNQSLTNNMFTCGNIFITNGICKSVTLLGKNKYSINIVATDSGEVSVNIPAGSLQSLSGNSNIQSTGASSVIYTPIEVKKTTVTSSECSSMKTLTTNKPTASSLNGKTLCKQGTPSRVSYSSSKLEWNYQCRNTTDGSSVSCKVAAILDSAPTCTAEPVELDFDSCKLKTTNAFTYYQYLTCLGITETKKSCNQLGCSQEAKRQELISIAVPLRGIPMSDDYECQGLYSDVKKTSASCETIEKARIAGLISAKNKQFRPLDTMTRAETFKVFLGSICQYPENTTSNWQNDVAKASKALGFTTRSVAAFEPNKPILRQELYVLSARVAQWKAENPDSCDDLPEELLCE